jgi:hypothetical protein
MSVSSANNRCETSIASEGLKPTKKPAKSPLSTASFIILLNTSITTTNKRGDNGSILPVTGSTLQVTYVADAVPIFYPSLPVVSCAKITATTINASETSMTTPMIPKGKS